MLNPETATVQELIAVLKERLYAIHSIENLFRLKLVPAMLENPVDDECLAPECASSNAAQMLRDHFYMTVNKPLNSNDNVTIIGLLSCIEDKINPAIKALEVKHD